MNTDLLLKDAEATLVAVNERFGWQGDEDDQAWDILTHVLRRQPDPDEDLPLDVAYRFDELVKRRATGEPLAFILGWVEFLDFKMAIEPGAFIPRLTSEFLAKQAIRRLRKRAKPIHIDLACGIGPVAIGSARAVPKAKVFGVDISKKAVRQAQANATKLGAGNATFLKGDMFSPLPEELRGKVDVISIHPPYVPKAEVADLPEEIKEYEPAHTLTDASLDGLGLTRRVISEGREWLGPKGWVLIEIVPTESILVRRMFREHGYLEVRSTHGELKLTRVICGRMP
ncbi:MAG: peptide chain release factor N(5)-glutamine methyltransferase [Actinomycetota bacterium]